MVILLDNLQITLGIRTDPITRHDIPWHQHSRLEVVLLTRPVSQAQAPSILPAIGNPRRQMTLAETHMVDRHHLSLLHYSNRLTTRKRPRRLRLRLELYRVVRSRV